MLNILNIVSIFANKYATLEYCAIFTVHMVMPNIMLSDNIIDSIIFGMKLQSYLPLDYVFMLYDIRMAHTLLQNKRATQIFGCDQEGEVEKVKKATKKKAFKGSSAFTYRHRCHRLGCHGSTMWSHCCNVTVVVFSVGIVRVDNKFQQILACWAPAADIQRQP